MTTSKSKEHFTEYSLVVRVEKVGFRYLANKYVGVFIADKKCRTFGVLLTTVLCTDYWIKCQKNWQLGKYYQILNLKFCPHFYVLWNDLLP